MPPKKSTNASIDDSDLKSMLEEHLVKIQKKIDDSENSVKSYFDWKFRLLNTKISELESISINASKFAKEALSKVNDDECSIEFNDEKISILKSHLLDWKIKQIVHAGK